MDFSLILFIALAITGVIWLWDKVVGAPRRAMAVNGVSGSTDMDQNGSRESIIVEYAKAFFPVILLVFVLRSFLVEPFRIPSGSMLPSLHIGDFILVNKFSYGIRLPVIHSKVIGLNDPQRGDVMVFRFPHDEKVNYIKRVIGLPGDEIVYDQKRLYINGELVELAEDGEFRFDQAAKRHIVAGQYRETLDDVEHAILIDPSRGSRPLKITVPEGEYFVMGDNRDHSNDSRYWGFVPDANIVGKAFYIWFSWDVANGGEVKWSRLGNTIE